MKRNLFRLAKKVVSPFGLTLMRKVDYRRNLDIIYPVLFEPENALTIFDVGANTGQSIKRFKNLFRRANLHCFEPISDNVEVIKQRYGNDSSVIINNLAVGEKKGIAMLNEYANNAHSSFHKLEPNTLWLEERSRQKVTKPDEYKIQERRVNITSLDEYSRKNGIKEIDILKIDTQGYEDRVLDGCVNLLRQQRIKVIELELIFSPIYEKTLTFSDIERNLVNHGYRLVGLNQSGNLAQDYIWQSDLVYINDVMFKKLCNSTSNSTRVHSD